MRFSIITINYNQGEYLEEAIQSVLQQNHSNVEYIVIDGDSDDGSQSIIEKYEHELDYWCSEPDDGPPSALNKGLEYASGDIFGFLNADDYLLPKALSRIAGYFEQQSDADVVSGHGRYVNERGEIIRHIFSDHWDLRRYVYGAINLVQQATFYRLDKVQDIGGFAEQNKTCWDGELWVDLSLSGNLDWHRLDEEIAAFRLHEESITGTNHKILENGKQQYIEDHDRMLKKALASGKIQPTKPIFAELEAWLSEPRNTVRNLVGRIAEISPSARALLYEN